MTTNYTRWYRIGKVNVTNKSTAVVGTDTYWASAGLHPGDIFSIDDTKSYEVDTIVDNTHLTLKTAYTGSTANGALYSIIRNFTSTTQAENAAQVTDLVGDMRRYIDTDMQSIHGKSAYEVAVSNGYVGTEQQWLNYLIGAGKWVELDTDTKARLASQDTKITGMQTTVNSFDSRTGVLRDGLASAAGTARGGFHNSIFRGCSLGSSLTAEQSATIQAAKFDDIWLGDHWDFSNVAYTYKDENGETQSATWSGVMRVAGCDYAWGCNGGVSKHHVAVIPDGFLFVASMNESADGVTGGYAASQMHTVHMQRALAIFEACFGADHIVPYTACYSNAVDSNGAVTGVVRSSSAKVELMNEAQHYGSRMMSCPKEYWSNEMVRQFPLFCVRPDLAGTRSGAYWLNGIADPSIPGNWAKAWCMDYCGHPVTWGSTYHGEGAGVRPFALVC